MQRANLLSISEIRRTHVHDRRGAKCEGEVGTASQILLAPLRWSGACGWRACDGDVAAGCASPVLEVVRSSTICWPAVVRLARRMDENAVRRLPSAIVKGRAMQRREARAC